MAGTVKTRPSGNATINFMEVTMMGNQYRPDLDTESQGELDIIVTMDRAANEFCRLVNRKPLHGDEHCYYSDPLAYTKDHESVVVPFHDDSMSYGSDGSMMFIIYDIDTNNITLRIPNTLQTEFMKDLLSEMWDIFDGLCAHIVIVIDGEIY